jgi:hydroxymethylpyrimidine/phosphomethylpyrimidine kinase
MKYFLTIAASDNSGGAGIQQDLKVAEDLGFWGVSAITGITIQDFKKMQSVYPIPPEILSEQIRMNINSFQINCVKIGAVCSEENIKAISTILKTNKLKNVILDPVFAPSHGKEFISLKSVTLFIEELLPLVNIITPNKNELSLLSGKGILNFDDGIEASRQLVNRFGCNVYLKGGHFDGIFIKEALITSNDIIFFEKERLKLKYSHGTGCTFSTALSCYSGQGLNLKDACNKATSYVSNRYKETGL